VDLPEKKRKKMEKGRWKKEDEKELSLRGAK
jgi:hypothetical protein